MLFEALLWYANPMRHILIILGHPNTESYCGAIAHSYSEAAKAAGAQVESVALARLQFDLILHKGYTAIQELEPDLIHLQNAIQAADHIVFIFPTWWGDVPALMKGAIDRVILPGFGFKYRKGLPRWDKLLAGKSARIVTTMDAPSWYYHLVYRSPGTNMLKRALLHFCGIRPVRTTYIDRLRGRSDVWRRKALERIAAIARKESRM